MVCQGYFGAPHGGNFVFTISSYFDDGAYIWIGEETFTQWSSENHDAASVVNQPGSVNITLAAGNFLPITILWIDLDVPGELAIGTYDNETDITYTRYHRFSISPTLH